MIQAYCYYWELQKKYALGNRVTHRNKENYIANMFAGSLRWKLAAKVLFTQKTKDKGKDMDRPSQ